jgi:hypothetical protein
MEEETEKKTINFKDLENQLKRQSKLTKVNGIAGLVLGTGFLAAGIFLPKEINGLVERIIEFSVAGISYVAAVGSYALYILNQIHTTELHMRPEYIDALHKSLMGE